MIRTASDLIEGDIFFDAFEEAFREVQHISIAGDSLRIICTDGRVDFPKEYPVYILPKASVASYR
jgi:hypothetical protein